MDAAPIEIYKGNIFLINSAPMQYDIGKKAIESGAQYVNIQLEKVNYGKLRKYFDVDSAYIYRKLLLILYPFGKPNGEHYSPDFYIPAVSLFSLLLLKCFMLGLNNAFHPEKLCFYVTRYICFHAIMVGVYKLMAYMASTQFALLDIAALAGYKYATALAMRLARFVPFGGIVGVALLVPFFLFLSRSLKQLLLHPGSSQSTLYLLFGFAFMDSILAFLFSR